MIVNERMVETTIEQQLLNLNWDTSIGGNVYRQSPKTAEQQRLLGRKKPDFVLYERDTDNPLIVIEAKKPHENLDKALLQGCEYAEKINAPMVFATDGIFTKTFHIKKKKSLYLNKEEVDELIEYSVALEFLHDNEFNTLDRKVIQSRDELISVFKELNEEFRAAGVRGGTERTELFCNILFLKVIDELSEQQGSLIKQLPNWCRWSKIKDKKGEELLTFINGQAFEHFKNAYDGEVLSPIRSLHNPNILNKVIGKLDDLHLSSTNRDIKGDAFEYFLRNYGGAETDFGEYFTPRHVVKALVKILNPQFGETIYDPFCGTGGMLINSFNHIYSRIKRTDDNIKFLKEETVYGGEITEMFRVAKMNMILTGDGHSNIQRQDSYKEKRTGKFDVVITNIPFGSKMKTEYAPQYGYNTKSAEVAGVAHCLDALSDSPHARAGIIVPEGVLFKNSPKAYQKLREEILEKHNLELVVSLPTNTFAPNTGVKSSILVVKKQRDTKKNHIWCFDVKNDGYSLDAHRRKLEGSNDLDAVISEKELNETEKERLSQLGFSMMYQKQVRENDYNLLGKKYLSKQAVSNTIYPTVKLLDICLIKKGSSITEKKANTSGQIPVIAGGKSSPYMHDRSNSIADEVITVSASGAYSGYIRYHASPIWSSDSSMITGKENIAITKYVYYVIKSKQKDFYRMQHGTGQPHVYPKDFQEYKIPLPPIEVQKQIVDEIEQIERVIEGAWQVIHSYQPSVYSKSTSFSFKAIKDICEIMPSKQEVSKMQNIEVSFLSMDKLGVRTKDTYSSIDKMKSDVIKGYTYFRSNDLLVAKITPCFENGKMSIARDLINDIGFGSTEFIVIRAGEKIAIEWVYYCLLEPKFIEEGRIQMTGTAGQKRISKNYIGNFKIPVPSLDVQKKIVKEIEEEERLVEANKELIELMEKKIEEKISYIWNENSDFRQIH